MDAARRRELQQALTRLADGDRSAFPAYVECTQADVWRFVVHQVGPAEADHVTRDALVRATTLTQVLGCSYDEAAEVCGVALGTIRSRVARAPAELIERLADDAAS